MARLTRVAQVWAGVTLLMTGLAWAQGPCTIGIETVAGYVPVGDGGAATAAALNYPSRVALDAAGNL